MRHGGGTGSWSGNGRLIQRVSRGPPGAGRLRASLSGLWSGSEIPATNLGELLPDGESEVAGGLQFGYSLLSII
jgi:hypothetical protein